MIVCYNNINNIITSFKQRKINNLVKKNKIIRMEIDVMRKELLQNAGICLQNEIIMKEFIMAKKKSTRELDAEIERLKRQVEIAELRKKLKKGAKK